MDNDKLVSNNWCNWYQI